MSKQVPKEELFKNEKLCSCTLESEINDPGTFINSSSFSHGYDLISEGTFINSNDFSIHDWKDKETYKTRKFGKHVFYSFQ